MPRLFLLSPALSGGKRAGYLLNPQAEFALSRRLHAEGITLGEAFSFTSGLYFRGKLAYAERFADPPPGEAGALVITVNRGLLSPATRVSAEDLRAFGEGRIDPADSRYRRPLARDVARLAAMDGALTVVLLGSIATGKYLDVLREALGDRLVFPVAFVGRGDMSRGALLLRAAREGSELAYAPAASAVCGRRG